MERETAVLGSTALLEATTVETSGVGATGVEIGGAGALGLLFFVFFLYLASQNTSR